jgi:hypothetical protein
MTGRLGAHELSVHMYETYLQFMNLDNRSLRFERRYVIATRRSHAVLAGDGTLG